MPAKRPGCSLTIDRRYRSPAVATDARIARLFKGRNAGCVYLRQAR